MDFYWGTEPIVRGIAITAVALAAIFIIKPGITHSVLDEDSGETVARGFKEQIFESDEDILTVPGTYFPYWLIAGIIFVIFGLLI